ncbi:MAG: pentapeptide repeat-containing protein [Chloroflexota bacterium]
MNEFIAALTFLLLFWAALLAVGWLIFRFPDTKAWRLIFDKVITWRPRHPPVAIIAGIVGLIGIFIIFQDEALFAGQLWKALKDLAPEMVGLAFTVVVIDKLNQMRIEQQRKQELIEQLYSPVRDIAVEALRLVRKKDGWWDEIDTKSFQGVQWAGADLENANLEGAYFAQADLEGAVLMGAKLQKARFVEVNLAGAILDAANVKGAVFKDVNFEEAEFTYVYFLETATLKNVNLSGTKYNYWTKWPKEISAKEAGAIKGEMVNGEWKPIE